MRITTRPHSCPGTCAYSSCCVATGRCSECKKSRRIDNAASAIRRRDRRMRIESTLCVARCAGRGRSWLRRVRLRGPRRRTVVDTGVSGRVGAVGTAFALSRPMRVSYALRSRCRRSCRATETTSECVARVPKGRRSRVAPMFAQTRSPEPTAMHLPLRMNSKPLRCRVAARNVSIQPDARLQGGGGSRG